MLMWDTIAGIGVKAHRYLVCVPKFHGLYTNGRALDVAGISEEISPIISWARAYEALKLSACHSEAIQVDNSACRCITSLPACCFLPCNTATFCSN